MTNFRPADLDDDALAVLRARAIKAGQWFNNPADIDRELQECTQILASLKDAVSELAADLGPKKKADVRRYSLYRDFLNYRQMCAQESISTDKRRSVTTPSTLAEAIDAYMSSIAGVEAALLRMEAAIEHPSGTLQMLSRQEALIDVKRFIIIDFLQHVLPPQHFAAIRSLGLEDIAGGEEAHGTLSFGIGVHVASIAANKDRLSQKIKTGKRGQPESTKILIIYLSTTWAIYTGKEPKSAANTSNDSVSPFYRFFKKAWLLVNTAPAPSSNVVDAILRQNRRNDADDTGTK